MERISLLGKNSGRVRPPGLTLLLATLCIIDLFGVFPIVTLPKPIIDCGWVGIPLSILLFSIQIYTAILLGRCWIIAEQLDSRIITKSRYPYAAVAELCFGVKVSWFVTGLLDLTVFGGSIPNLIYASVNLHLVGLKAFNSDISFCYWLIILGLIICPVLWLGSPRDMKWLAITSVTIVCSVSLLTWICILTDKTETPATLPPEINWANVAIAYGILAFQFDIHPMVLTVQVDMAERQRLSQAVLASFLVTGGLFAITACLAYLRYGQQTEPNLIRMLPASWPVYLDTCLVTAQIWLSMVVGVSPLFQHLEDKLAIAREFNWRRCVLRTALLLAVLGIALLIPRFDLVMSLVGGTLTGPLMFVFPPLFYMRLKGMQAYASKTNKASKNFKYQSPVLMYSELEVDTTNSSSSSDGGYQYDVISNRGISTGSVAPYNPRLAVSSTSSSYHSCLESLSSVDSQHLPSIPKQSSDRHRSVSTTTSDDSESSSSVSSSASRISWWERMVCWTTVVLGLFATAFSTYFSIKHAVDLAGFTPPCFTF